MASEWRDEMRGPMHIALRSGTKVFSEGRAKVLHYSPRAINLQFHDRVITVLNRDGILSPSSIVVDADTFPVPSSAEFHGDVLVTDRFRVMITNFTDLRMSGSLRASSREVASAILPYIQPRRNSISTALLMLRGMPCALQGVEKAVAEKELSVLRDCGSWGQLSQNILGLGFGLTPSGDDFMVGVIAVLNMLRADTSEVSAAVDSYANPFSRTILKNALDANYVEPLFSLLKTSKSVGPGRAEILSLLAVGHTSGLDTLSGMYYALRSDALAREASALQKSPACSSLPTMTTPVSGAIAD